MLRLALTALILVSALYAANAAACEKCYSYFNSQSLEWCEYCDGAYCGYFNCVIKYYQGMGGYYCTGDDAGCFEVGRGCIQEPQMQLTAPLRQWRLARVDVHHQRTDQRGQRRWWHPSPQRGRS